MAFPDRFDCDHDLRETISSPNPNQRLKQTEDDRWRWSSILDQQNTRLIIQSTMMAAEWWLDEMVACIWITIGYNWPKNQSRIFVTDELKFNAWNRDKRLRRLDWMAATSIGALKADRFGWRRSARRREAWITCWCLPRGECLEFCCQLSLKCIEFGVLIKSAPSEDEMQAI